MRAAIAGKVWDRGTLRPTDESARRFQVRSPKEEGCRSAGRSYAFRRQCFNSKAPAGPKHYAAEGRID